MVDYAVQSLSFKNLTRVFLFLNCICVSLQYPCFLFGERRMLDSGTRKIVWVCIFCFCFLFFLVVRPVNKSSIDGFVFFYRLHFQGGAVGIFFFHLYFFKHLF